MKQYDDEDDEPGGDVVIECNKPCLPDWFDGRSELLHWLSEFGKIGFGPEKTLSIVRPRMTQEEFRKVCIAIRLPGTDEYLAYQSGQDAADFELMYALQMRACGADKDATQAAELLLKLRTSQSLRDEIQKRFMT
ncbi:MAG: hypothetical protein RR202_10555 [Bacteroidales bacterium]